MFLEISKYNSVQNRSWGASVPKISSIHPAISIQYRLVIDKQMHRHRVLLTSLTNILLRCCVCPLGAWR